MLLVSHPPSARAVLVHHAAELAHVNGSLVEGKIGPFDPAMPDDDDSPYDWEAETTCDNSCRWTTIKIPVWWFWEL